MHIKNIIISGFRSYLEQRFASDMSPRHNVIVGRNGSGKSNFFAAVQFVLGEKFTDLRPNERRDLFHVGASRPGLSVFVEIVFDNTDGRLVIPGRADEPEVRVRRTLGLKHDEYRVNDRKFSVTEVRQLFESAGLSSANPYYIVEQGQIVNLAHMKEDERYQLLKDVAGTKVYESRRQESESILEDTSSKMQKIEETVGQLDDKLKSLERDTSELKAFQQVDAKRKLLEHSIYHSELTSAQRELDGLEAHLNTQVHTVNEHRDRQAALEHAARHADDKAEQLGQRIKELDLDRKTLDKERTAVAARKEIASLKEKEAVGVSSRDEAERNALSKEETELKKVLSKAKTDAGTKEKSLVETKAASEGLTQSLAAMEHRLETLQARRGRKNQFRTKHERDAWIDSEISKNKSVVAQNQAEIRRITTESERLGQQLTAQQASLKSKQVSFSQSDSKALEVERRHALSERDRLNGQRRSLWQNVSDQESAVRRAQVNVDRHTHSYDKIVRLDIRQGYKSLLECVEEMGDDRIRQGVHGQLIDLMTFDPTLAAAIEATAGNVLFNVVVDSFDTSARILEHFNRRHKPGRVTFFPIDTVNATPKNMPASAEFSPLLSHVKYDPKFAKVFAEVFGRTALASSLEVASRIVSEHQCDVVTTEGDSFNRKGAITGGFVDSRFSRIVAVNGLRNAAVVCAEEKARLAQLCQEVATVEQSITLMLQKLESFHSQEANTHSAIEAERLEFRSMEEQASRLAEQLANNEEARRALDRQNAVAGAAIEELLAERDTDVKATLTAAEDKELERLQAEIGGARAETEVAQGRLVQIATEVQVLNDSISHVDRRLVAVQDRIKVLTMKSTKAPIAITADVASFDAELQSLDKRLRDLDSQIDGAHQARKKLEDEATAARRSILEQSKEQQDEVANVDRAQNQRTALLTKKEDALQRIRRLGVVVGDAKEYASFSIGKLLHQLRLVNDEMKKFSHVNKKALDQYTTLLDARNDLRQKREALQTELESIHKLMTHLDEQKSEAIERTYKQVQHNFETVFKELIVAEGATAQLQLVKATDRNTTDTFSGVRIRVGFGLGGATAELSQLSGGQKSLVALSLIFAIQRCDPAPFYLFDEIDAALDAEYRTSVAQMLHRQSESCQFITATFKTELLDVADRVYGIFFNNKVSRIQNITKEEGALLLKQAAQDDRKRTREASVAE